MQSISHYLTPAEWQPRRILVGILLLLLLVLPSAGTAALRSFLLVGCAICLLWIYSRERPALPPFLWIFAIWGAAGILSITNAENPLEVLRNTKSDVGYAALMYIAFFVAGTRPDFFFTFRRMAVLTLAFFSISGLVGAIAAGGRWSPGFYNQLGEYNTFVTITLPLALSALLPSTITAATRLERWLTAVAIACALGACLLSDSRGIWINLAIASIGISAYAYRTHPRRWQIIGILAVAVTCTALLAAYSVSAQRHLTLSQSNGREAIYAAAWEHIKETPFFGHGYGRTTSEVFYTNTFKQWGNLIEHPHNVVLSYLDQAGVFGLIALLCIFLPFARYLVRQITSNPQAIFAALGLVLLASFFLRSMLDMFFYGQNLWLYWAHCGVFIAQLASYRQRGIASA